MIQWAIVLNPSKFLFVWNYRDQCKLIILWKFWCKFVNLRLRICWLSTWITPWSYNRKCESIKLKLNEFSISYYTWSWRIIVAVLKRCRRRRCVPFSQVKLILVVWINSCLGFGSNKTLFFKDYNIFINKVNLLENWLFINQIEKCSKYIHFHEF